MKTIFASVFLLLILVAAIIPTSSFMVQAQEAEQTQAPEQTQTEEGGEQEDNGETENATPSTEFTAEVEAGEDSVIRGSEQTITVDSSDPAQIFGTITYASNFTRAFVGNTNDDGVFEHTWVIGGNSKPGTFKVDVIAISSLDNRAAQASTSFVVTTAGAEAILTPTPGPITPAENGTVTEGNGTIIVPEEPIPINITEGNITEIPPGAIVNETIPSINETIPIPVPINETAGNVTIPVPIPVNSTTNETVDVPVLPINETVPVSNETVSEGPVAGNETTDTTTPEDIQDEIIIIPSNETVIVTPDNGTDISIDINETEVIIPTNETTNPEPTNNQSEVIVAPENDTIVLTPDNDTDAGPVEEEPIQVNETVDVVPGDIVDIAENETAAEIEEETGTGLNQSEQLPTEIPINATTGNVTEPIPIPINTTTGNQTVEVPPIDVQIPENMTEIPVPVNETTGAPIPANETTGGEETEPPLNASNGNGEATGVKDIIDELDQRVVELEDTSATQQEVFAAVGTAIEQMGDAISIIPGLTGEEQADIIDAVNNVKNAIAGAVGAS